MKYIKNLAIVGLLTLALTGCQTIDVAARSAETTPDKSTDEGGLWMQSEKFEEQIRQSGQLISDPELNEYVSGLTCKVAAEYCKDVRVYLLKSPSFNAFMMPNGTMAVFSGLMLRAENEAQLAAVLGHEVGHYEENHSLERHRSLKRTSAFMLVGDMAVGYGAGSLLGIMALQSYSRDHEREADEIGFRRLEAAGYDAAEASKVWLHLIEESQSSDFRKKRNRTTRAGLLDSHPAPPERAETLRSMAARSGSGGTLAAEQYREKIAPFLFDWLDADLQARDYGTSLNLISRLKAADRDLGILTFYEGEAYRQRANDGDAARALERYENAATYADAPAVTWRALGEAYRKLNRDADAASAYETYLKRAPDAPDAALIKRAAESLRKAS